MEVHPADVGAPGQTPKVAEAVVIHTAIIGSVVLILDAIDGRAVTEVDPADVRAPEEAGAHVVPDNSAVGDITARVDPTDVGPPGGEVGRVDRCGPAGSPGGSHQPEGEKARNLHRNGCVWSARGGSLEREIRPGIGAGDRIGDTENGADRVGGRNVVVRRVP